MKAYKVTTYDNEYIVDADAIPEAKSKVCNNFNVDPDKIVDTEVLERKINLIVQGEYQDINDALESIINEIDQLDASVEYRDKDNIVYDLPDEDAKRIRVDRWDDITMRVTGTEDSIDADGIDMSPDMIAEDDSVVEVIVNDEIILRAIK